MTKKLKLCPFCGGEAQVNERYRSGTANRKMYWISCSACGISQQHDNTSGYRYQSKAIDRWNRREPIDEIVKVLEEYKELECDDIDDDIDEAVEDAEELYDIGRSQGKLEAYLHAIEIVKGASNETD